MPGTQLGQCTSIAFVNGIIFAAWTDDSNTLGNNPDLQASGDAFADSTDIAVARIAVAAVVAGPPVVTGRPISCSEGSAFSGPVATFTDNTPTLVSTDFSATINWGDGTPEDTSAVILPFGLPCAGNFVVNGTHNYSTPAAYAVTVTVHDNVDNLSGTTESGVSQQAGGATDSHERHRSHKQWPLGGSGDRRRLWSSPGHEHGRR